jgi:hypothetical protein
MIIANIETILVMKTAVIVLLVFLTSAFPLLLSAQRHIVSGRIFDSSSQMPVNQISVFEKTSGIGTMTNEEGGYSLMLSRGEIELVYTGINYEAVKIGFALKSDTLINLTLNAQMPERNRRSRKESNVLVQHSVQTHLRESKLASPDK